MDSKKYRKNVGIILMNRDGLVLAGRPTQSCKDGTWQMPQGGIDPWERPVHAARRELFEETGVTQTILLKESEREHTYHFPKWVMEEREKKGLRKYLGQTQRWFLFLYTGTDIAADTANRKDKELTDFEWVDIRTLPEKVIPFKRKVYEAVVKEFAKYIDTIVKSFPKDSSGGSNK